MKYHPSTPSPSATLAYLRLKAGERRRRLQRLIAYVIAILGLASVPGEQGGGYRAIGPGPS